MQSKYHAKKVKTDDGVFDSKREYQRWLGLKTMQERGTITNLHRQVPFELIPKQLINGKVVERACVYKADFVYTFMGETIVEDSKGFHTPEYIIKRKLLLYRYGIKIMEV